MFQIEENFYCLFVIIEKECRYVEENDKKK